MTSTKRNYFRVSQLIVMLHDVTCDITVNVARARREGGDFPQRTNEIKAISQ